MFRMSTVIFMWIKYKVLFFVIGMVFVFCFFVFFEKCKALQSSQHSNHGRKSTVHSVPETVMSSFVFLRWVRFGQIHTDQLAVPHRPLFSRVPWTFTSNQKDCTGIFSQISIVSLLRCCAQCEKLVHTVSMCCGKKTDTEGKFPQGFYGTKWKNCTIKWRTLKSWCD